MKGVIFTEFLTYVENHYGIATVDTLITATSPPSGGAYTAVGTYDVSELVAMLMELSRISETPVSELTKSFGKHLFQHFAVAHADTMAGITTAEQLLGSVGERIHGEVRKLFPDAELPSIDFCRINAATSELHYRSSRPLADLAEGLILASIEHFGDSIQVSRTDLAPGKGTHAVFQLIRK